MSENEKVIIRRLPDGQIEIELTGISVRQLSKVVDALRNPSVVLAESELDSTLGLDLPMPSEQEIAEFIKQQPNYEHSLVLVSEHFFKQPLHASTSGRQNATYQRLNYILRKAHATIERAENGHFLSRRVRMEKNGRSYLVFTFQRLQSQTGA
jgi:hypothetical protein